MKVRSMPLGDIAVLRTRPPVNGHRPSVDVLFRSVAEEFGPQPSAVIDDRNGRRRRRGMGAVKAAGGMTIAQSEETCVVYRHAQGRHRAGLCHPVVALGWLG